MAKKHNFKAKSVISVETIKIKTRDQLMVVLINGATKSGIKPDRKKVLNKTLCRKYVGKENDEDH